MRLGCVKIESEGSYWWIDERSKEYMRLPKEEKPRERPEWGDERAGALQDAIWHPYEEWKLDPRPSVRDYLIFIELGEWPEHYDSDEYDLRIYTSDGCTVAPLAKVVIDKT